MQPPTSPDVASPAKTPLFQSSTQYKHWRFSAEQLRTIRTVLNEAAIAAIRNTFESDSVRIVLTEFTCDEPMCLAWLIFRCSFPRRSRGAPPRQIVYHQDISAVWPLSLPRRGRGDWNNLFETFLPQEHRDGLASQERYVRQQSTDLSHKFVFTLYYPG